MLSNLKNSNTKSRPVVIRYAEHLCDLWTGRNLDDSAFFIARKKGHSLDESSRMIWHSGFLRLVGLPSETDIRLVQLICSSANPYGGIIGAAVK